MTKQCALAACVLAAGFAGCATVPLEEDPVYLKLIALESRLIRIERIIDNESLLELLGRVDQLQLETQELRGGIETMQHELEGTANRQRDLFVDLDQRLETLEKSATRMSRLGVDPTGASAPNGGPLAPGQLPVPAGTDRANYQAAFEQLKEGRYDQASAAFQQFLVAFPDSPLADNAQYWFAETHYVTRKFDMALPAFEKVLQNYPESRKVPDALLKIGYCNYELSRHDAARTALQQVFDEYPDTTAARLAGQRLAQMESDG